jgi:sigma-B regulation protein RsbU (phosphoserine phosphatase)
MAIVRTLVRLSRHRYMGIGETMGLVNSHLLQIIGQENDFVTLFAADIDFGAQKMEYVNAGHCPGLLLRRGQAEKLSPCAPLLGFFDLDFRVQEVDYPDRAQLFLYTDGFYEWEKTPGEYMDPEEFWNLAVEEMRREGDFLEGLMQRLSAATPERPRFRDDLTALWVRPETSGV